MDTPARYVATAKEGDDCQQTFVFDGTMTLDQVFAHVAERGRGGGFAAIADRLSGKHKVFSLSISHDESCEPTASDRLHERFGFEREPA